jgi:hypothetical protein
MKVFSGAIQHAKFDDSSFQTFVQAHAGTFSKNAINFISAIILLLLLFKHIYPR